MRKWPKCSEEPAYPIKDTDSKLPPKAQYFTAKITFAMLEGNQGKLRHELVDYMLAELEKML